MNVALVLILAVGGLLLAEKMIGGFGSDATGKLAAAIAHAEGFGVTGTVPTRTNNPGDLELGDLGKGTQGGKTIFATLTDGIAALRKQISIIANGQSEYYSLDMSISQMAQLYTGGDNADAWAQIVATDLGVTPQTTLGEIL